MGLGYSYQFYGLSVRTIDTVAKPLECLVQVHTLSFLNQDLYFLEFVSVRLRMIPDQIIDRFLNDLSVSNSSCTFFA